MSREISVRQIIVVILTRSLSQSISTYDLTKRVVEIVHILKDRGIEVPTSFRRIGSDRYSSADVTYEIGLLGSTSFLKVCGSQVVKGEGCSETEAYLCSDLDEDVRKCLFEVVGIQ